MANRKTNGRVTPDAITNNQLEVTAAPVNKLQTFRPDLSEAQKTKQTYEGLAAFGKGVLDLNMTYKRQAQQHMLAYYAQTEKKNRDDWNEVSKNVKGMAKFNPYNKDAYHQIQSAEVLRKSLMEIESIPELEKMDNDSFNALLEQKQKEAITQLQQYGISEKNYQNYLLDYDNKITALKHAYVNKNTEYQYGLYKNKVASDGGLQYYQGVRDNGHDKVTAIKGVTDTLVTGMNMTGTPDDTQAVVIMQAVKNAVAIDPSKFKSSDIVTAFSGYKINGKTMNELIPDFDAQMTKLVRDAKQADLADQKLEYETKQFNQQMSRESAITEFVDIITTNPNLSPQEQQQTALNLKEKYGLDGVNSIQLFNDLATGRKTFNDLKNIPSDPEVRQKLAAGIGIGETTMMDITNAMNENKLSYQDWGILLDKLQTSNEKKKKVEDKRVDEHTKETLITYVKGDGKNIKPKISNKDVRGFFTNQVMDLQGQYEQGNITYEEYNNKSAFLKSTITDAEKVYKNSRSIKQYIPTANLIAQGTHITDKQWKQLNVRKSTAAFKAMGLVEGGNNVYITSAPQQNRQVKLSNGTTQNQPHKGYDLGGANVYSGRPVFAPMEGRVVGVFKNAGGAGNMVIVRCENGKYIKYMHLQNTGLPMLGDVVSREQKVAFIGGTGNVENKQTGSLHVEFFDEQGNWIPAYKFK